MNLQTNIEKEMNKQEIIYFFNQLAPQWDERMIRNEEVIRNILDNAKVTDGVRVLDVACGTGVLIPDYLLRNVASITAVDFSPEMIKIASSKFNNRNVQFICGDVETLDFEQKFDCIVVYNAFPHFPDPRALIRALAALLNKDGTLTVAHGMSRTRINEHHSGAASKVSIGLLELEELTAIFGDYCDVIIKISDDIMYQVTGVLK